MERSITIALFDISYTQHHIQGREDFKGRVDYIHTFRQVTIQKYTHTGKGRFSWNGRLRSHSWICFYTQTCTYSEGAIFREELIAYTRFGKLEHTNINIQGRGVFQVTVDYIHTLRYVSIHKRTYTYSVRPLFREESITFTFFDITLYANKHIQGRRDF